MIKWVSYNIKLFNYVKKTDSVKYSFLKKLKTKREVTIDVTSI